MIGEDGSSLPTDEEIEMNCIVDCPGSDGVKCDWTGTLERWQYHHIETGHA